MCFFSFLFLKHPFPFYSPIILIFWFIYLQTCIKESCLYLSSELFLKTSHETLEFQEKYFLQRPPGLNFKNFSFGVYHGAIPRSHWTMQSVKKLNLWVNVAVDKSSWIKAWLYIYIYIYILSIYCYIYYIYFIFISFYFVEICNWCAILLLNWVRKNTIQNLKGLTK